LELSILFRRLFLGTYSYPGDETFYSRPILFLPYYFGRELLLANVQVIRDILRPKLDIKPGIFALPTDLKSDWEITLLSLLITLTPGTLVMDISDDNKILYIHAINMPDADQAISDIKNSFEKAIMEVTR
jgi:multicomponent Na+:H+ antiporter subunit E